MTNRPIKGRGATSNIVGRFQRISVELEPGADPDEVPRAPETVIHHDPARTIISTNRSSDVPFDYSINPYKGCEHGCIYCYARPSHAYLDLSPGLDFETQIYAKDDAPALLRFELSKRSYVCKTICIGANRPRIVPKEPRPKYWASTIFSSDPSPPENTPQITAKTNASHSESAEIKTASIPPAPSIITIRHRRGVIRSAR